MISIDHDSRNLFLDDLGLEFPGGNTGFFKTPDPGDPGINQGKSRAGGFWDLIGSAPGVLEFKTQTQHGEGNFRPKYPKR